MKKLITLSFIALIASLIFTACDPDDICVRAHGDVKKENYFLEDIHGINADLAAKIYFTYGETQSIEVEAQEDIHDRLKTTVKDGIWNIDLDGCISKHKDIKIYITLPYFDVIDIDGAVDVETLSPFENLGDVKIDVDGAAEIRLHGSANHIDINIDGSGDFRGYEFAVKSADIDVDGASDVELNVSEKLVVKIDGAGCVKYSGSPDIIDSKINGAGSIKRK